MSSALKTFGEIIIGVNYLLTCVLVGASSGLGWGIISFAIPPIGALIAPFWVGTWMILLAGASIILIGFVMERRNGRRNFGAFNQLQEIPTSTDTEYLFTAEIEANAKKVMMLSTDSTASGKMYGDSAGALLFLAEDGSYYTLGNSVMSWGFELHSIPTKTLHIVSHTWDAFEIDEKESQAWKTWMSKHHGSVPK